MWFAFYVALLLSVGHGLGGVEAGETCPGESLPGSILLGVDDCALFGAAEPPVVVVNAWGVVRVT